jgi:hypothetical protein
LRVYSDHYCHVNSIISHNNFGHRNLLNIIFGFTIFFFIITNIASGALFTNLSVIPGTISQGDPITIIATIDSSVGVSTVNFKIEYCSNGNGQWDGTTYYCGAQMNLFMIGVLNQNSPTQYSLTINPFSGSPQDYLVTTYFNGNSNCVVAGNCAFKGFTVTPPQTQPLYVTVSESPDPVTSGSNSQVTVYVTTTGGTPVSGASVSVSANGGSLTPTTGTTSATGYFTSTYTAPTVTASTTFTISATASMTGYTNGSGSDTITVTPPQTQSLYVTVSESPDPVTSGSNSQVTVYVTTTGGTPVSGASVSVSANGGSLTPTTGTTSATGYFTSTYTAPTVTASTTFTISATASMTGYTNGSGSDTITVNPSQIQPGDVTGNGVVDAVDSMFLAQYVTGTRPTLPQPQAGDVAQPCGVIDAVDSMFVAQYVAGTRPSLQLCS